MLDYSQFRDPPNQETDIEDLFPTDLYLEAFNTAYKKELKRMSLKVNELNPGAARIVGRIDRWLETKGIKLLNDGGFNHYRVAQSLISEANLSNVGNDCLSSFTSLFGRVNKLLA